MTCCDQELHKVFLVSEANLEPKTLPRLYLFPSVGIQSRKIQEIFECECLRGVEGSRIYEKRNGPYAIVRGPTSLSVLKAV